MEEFRRLAFEGMPDELEDPPQNEKAKSIGPQMVNEEGGHQDRDRDHDQWNAECVTKTVDRMLVAAGILRDPLLTGAVA